MPTILNGANHMQAVLYTGTGATQTISGLNFQPDFVWIKSRSAATDHKLTDSVRGATKALISNSTAAETTDSTGVTAFTSTGFTLGAASAYNTNGATYVAWCWKAGGTAVTNTAGSITSSVSANASAGFSVVTFTAPSSGAWTVGHGLGAIPQFFITKSRSNAYSWGTYHVSIGNTGRLDLNSTNAVTTSQNSAWNNTSPTSTVFSMGSDWSGAGITYVAYCFAAIPGYSAFGSFSGNASTDGTFVYTGFLPRVVLVKCASGTGNWFMLDSSRNTYNVVNNQLYPNLSNAESATTTLDILSNGFKMRTSSDPNASATYVYAAWASNPFTNSLAY